MKNIKALLAALAIASPFASAEAADLASIKDPLPDTLTWYGVTLYGSIDIGYSYQTAGLQASSSSYVSVPFSLYGSQYAKDPHYSFVNNGLSQSFIGLKIEEDLGFDTKAIGKIETYLNPAYGEIPDQCRSLIEAVTNGYKTNAGDGRVCGQPFGGEVYGGVSNATYGTLTIGRQAALGSEVTGKYDPLNRSYAFSAFGATGTFSSGSGATSASLWDGSIKYRAEYGPVHAAFLYMEGGEGSAIHGDSVGASAGFTYQGLSVDASYTNQHDVVNTPTGVAFTTNQMVYFMTDDEAWHVGAKYSFEFGGGYKDDLPSKLTLMGGYIHIDATDGGTDTGGTTQGGYVLAKNAFRLTSTRTLETIFGGARYEIGPWTASAGYYHTTQNNFTINVQTSCSQKNAGVCAGDFNSAGAVIDYAFNKHFDVYLGAQYSELTGGFAHNLASGASYLSNDDFSVSSGIRLKF